MNGHDEVARQMIQQHMAEYDKHQIRVEDMFASVNDSIQRLHKRWDHALWSVIGCTFVIVGAMTSYLFVVRYVI